MSANDAGYKAAARHFGLPVDRVKWWVHAEKVAKAKGPAKAGNRGGGKEKGETAKPEPQPSRTRDPDLKTSGRRTILDLASAPAMAAKLRRGAWALADVVEGLADIREAHAAAKAERARLRASGMDAAQIDKLCPLPEMPDLKQIESGARSLRELFLIAPGLASFDSETGGKETAGGATPEEREKARRMMLAEEPVAALSVVDGGRVGTG